MLRTSITHLPRKELFFCVYACYWQSWRMVIYQFSLIFQLPARWWIEEEKAGGISSILISSTVLMYISETYSRLHTVPFRLIRPSCVTGPLVLAWIRSPVPRHNPYGRRLLVDPKNSQKCFQKYIYRCGTYATFFSTYLFKEDTDWSMRDILKVQMLSYSKIMLGNCWEIVVIFGPPSSLQLWVATNEWSDPRTDPTIPF